MTLERSGPSHIAAALELVQLQPPDGTPCAPGQVPLPAVDRDPFGGRQLRIGDQRSRSAQTPAGAKARCIAGGLGVPRRGRGPFLQTADSGLRAALGPSSATSAGESKTLAPPTTPEI